MVVGIHIFGGKHIEMEVYTKKWNYTHRVGRMHIEMDVYT